MSKVNNYTKADGQPSIEINLYHDSDIAVMWFDESFTIIDRDSWGRISNVFYGDMPQFDWYLDNTLEELQEFIQRMEDNEGVDPENLLAVLRQDYGKLNLGLIDDFNETYTGLNLKTRQDVDYVRSYGYCQGDIAQVWFLKSNPIDRKEADHLLWDQPIRGYITVDGVKVSYDEIMHDYYDFDADMLATKLNERFPNIARETFLALAKKVQL